MTTPAIFERSRHSHDPQTSHLHRLNIMIMRSKRGRMMKMVMMMMMKKKRAAIPTTLKLHRLNIMVMRRSHINNMKFAVEILKHILTHGNKCLKNRKHELTT